MILRISHVILFMFLLNGCSNQGSDQPIDEVSSESSSITLAESNPGSISVVCGVIYKVEDFNTWLEAYNKIAVGTIVQLRNVIDPSLVIVFEGNESLTMAEGRAAALSDNDFLNSATVMGDPIIFYNNVRYMSPSQKAYKHYVALMFEMEDISKFLESLKTDIGLYASHGLTPMGIGTNPHSPEQVYMLLTLEDFVSFRKKINSPRKIRRFATSLNLPEETLILNLARTDL